MGIGDFTPDDATAGAAGGSSSGTTDLYGLGVVGNGPIYSTQSQQSMGEHSGGGMTTSVPLDTQATGNSLAAHIAGLSQSDPAAFQQWQSMLYAADFYSGKPRIGVFGSADMNALKAALTAYQQVNGQANTEIGKGQFAQPQAFDAWLQQRIGQVKKTGGPGAGSTRAPLTISYTDPAALHETLQSAAQEGLGRDLTPDEANAFVGEFHGKEAAAQRAAYNDASSVTPPEATGEAKSFVDSRYQTEHQQRLAASYLDSISRMLGVL